MKSIMLLGLSFFLLCCFRFPAYASEHLIPAEGQEYQEIMSMRAEAAERVSEGGAGTALKWDAGAEEMEAGEACRLYDAPGLLQSEDPVMALEGADYIWQIPVYAGDATIVTDLVRETETPEDSTEDQSKRQEGAAGDWTEGAVYIYEGETVDYGRAVSASLSRAGYDPDEYSYEVVSALPGIRYPVAVVFDAEKKPAFVIPAQRASVHAFSGKWPEAEEGGKRTALLLPEAKDGGGFPVYFYADVKAASAYHARFGMGRNGLSYQQNGISKSAAIRLLALGVVGLAGLGFMFHLRAFRHRHKAEDR